MSGQEYFKPPANFMDEHACYNPLAHVLRTSSRSHRIFHARWFLEYQEARQACKGIGDACGGDHRPRHDVWGH